MSRNTKLELAGSASVMHAGDPSLLEINRWNADTGATSHMTPHLHWFHSYTPKVIPVKCADGNIIYSAGVGKSKKAKGKKGKKLKEKNARTIQRKWTIPFCMIWTGDVLTSRR